MPGDRNAVGLIDAIDQQQLATYLESVEGESDDPLIEAARAACNQIRDEVNAQMTELVDALRTAGHPVTWSPLARVQRHHVELQVPSVDAAKNLGAALEELGYPLWQQISEPALEATWHYASSLTYARTKDVTFAVRVRWQESPSPSVINRVFRPAVPDYEFIDLPPWAWRAYPLVRPVRLALERTGIRKPTSIAPFLATPQSLIQPLIDFAALGASDHLVDLGCGDGRIAIEAAKLTGCSALGIEHSPDLVQRARAAAQAAGVDARVRVLQGDLRSADLSAATAVFSFLPAPALAEALPAALEALPAGGRVIAHEQTALPAFVTPSPDRSAALFGPNAVTVAHLWQR